jgi:hypothetical protein
LVTTSRRRRFADLDRYVDLHAATNPPPRTNRHNLPAAPVIPAGIGHHHAPTFVEMGSGLALAVGVVLTTASMVTMAVACGWALLTGL